MNCIKLWNSQQIRICSNDRYVCLTDMAQAESKRVNNWSQLQLTTDFIVATASVTGIPVTELVVTKQGGKPEQQGTWAHPYVAIQFAQWSNPLFALQVSTWVDELLTTGRVSLVDEPLTMKDALQANAIVAVACGAIDIMFSHLPMKGEVLAGLKLSVAEQVTPEIIPYMNEVRQMIITDTATKDRLLTVTEIGARLGLSAQAVNKKLILLGLQSKNPNKRSKKDCSYIPTGQGLEFAEITLATGLGKDQTTYQQVRWYESLVSLM